MCSTEYVVAGILVLFLICVLISGSRNTESYEDVKGYRYYSPRLYARNVYDYIAQKAYPNNYKPYEYYAKFDSYYPYDYEYGTGSW